MNIYKFSWSFLETRLTLSKYYLSNGDRVGAAALAGAVLETSLRKISSYKELPVKKSWRCTCCGSKIGGINNLGSLITYLAETKQISVALKNTLSKVREIRNSAAHGHFGTITKRDCHLIINCTESIVNIGKKITKT